MVCCIGAAGVATVPNARTGPCLEDANVAAARPLRDATTGRSALEEGTPAVAAAVAALPLRCSPYMPLSTEGRRAGVRVEPAREAAAGEGARFCAPLLSWDAFDELGRAAPLAADSELDRTAAVRPAPPASRSTSLVRPRVPSCSRPGEGEALRTRSDSREPEENGRRLIGDAAAAVEWYDERVAGVGVAAAVYMAGAGRAADGIRVREEARAAVEPAAARPPRRSTLIRTRECSARDDRRRGTRDTTRRRVLSRCPCDWWPTRIGGVAQRRPERLSQAKSSETTQHATADEKRSTPTYTGFHRPREATRLAVCRCARPLCARGSDHCELESNSPPRQQARPARWTRKVEMQPLPTHCCPPHFGHTRTHADWLGQAKRKLGDDSVSPSIAAKRRHRCNGGC